MGKKNIITLIACILLLLCTAQASALSEDFSASSSKTIYVGECSSGLNKILIKNTGDVSSHYTLSVDGDASMWVSFAPNAFILNPGDYKTVYMNIKVPCSTSGAYSLETYITTKLGAKKALRQEIEVRDVHNIQLEPVDYSETITPCKTAVFRFSIKNPGDFAETYEFSSKPFSGNTVFSQKSMTLKAGETGQLQIYVTPDCNVWGSYDLELYTKAKLSGAAAKTEGIRLEIERDYDFSLTFGGMYVPEANKTPEIDAYGGDYFLCEEEQGAIPVLVKNTASVENTYYFELEGGKKWTTLSGDVATLKPGQSAYVNINVAPPGPMREDFDITLKVNSEFGGIEKTVTRKVAVDVCHIPVIAEGIGKIKTYYNESFAALTIHNTGSKETNYKLEASGAGWISVGPARIRVAPGEEKEFNLHLNPTDEAEEGKYHLSLKATVEENNVQYVKDIVVSIKEPRFANMIFDEYLVYTILLIVLLLAFLVIVVAVAIHLENTKEERAARAEQRRKEREILRIKRQKEKEQRMLEKQALRLRREKEREERRKQREVMLLQKQKEREKRKLEKEKERERQRAEKEKIRLEKEKEKEKRAAEKEKEREKRRAEKEKLMLEKEKENEERAAEKEKEKERKKAEKERLLLKRQKEKEIKEAKAQVKPEKEIKAPAAAKAPKKPADLKWLKWVYIAAIVIVALAIFGFAFFKLLPAIAAYRFYWIAGIAAAAVIIAILIAGEVAFSKFYKWQSWDKLFARQKAVVVLSWRKGLGEIVIRLKRSVEGARISVKRNIRQSTFVAAGEKVYQYFEIRKKNFSNEDIEKASFRFRVKKKWLQKHNIPAGTIKLVRYNNEQWAGIKTDKVMEDKRYFYYRADSTACSLFAIIGKPKFVPKPVVIEKKPKKIEKVVVEKKVIEKKVQVKKEKPKKARRKPWKGKSDALRILGIIVLVAIIIAFVSFGVLYAVKNISFVPNATQENVTEYVSGEAGVEVEPEEAIEEEIAEEPEPEPEVEEEVVEELGEEEVLEELEEAEEKPGLWSRFVSWLGSFVQKIEVSETMEDIIEEQVEEEIAEEEPIIEEEAVVEEEPEPEPEVEEEVVEELGEEEVPEELEEEEEAEEKPGLWSRFVSWLGSFVRKVEINETTENITEEIIINEPVEEQVEEEIAEEEPIIEEEAVEEPEEEELPVPEGGIPHQTWGMDAQHTLDLSEYFHDPDNDILNYTHTPLEHITVEIDGNSIATFTPEEGWEGEELAVFTADDGKGGSVDSNPFRLKVVSGYTVPLRERIKGLFSLYSDYVLIGLLILVIIILLIEFRGPIMRFLEED